MYLLGSTCLYGYMPTSAFGSLRMCVYKGLRIYNEVFIIRVYNEVCLQGSTCPLGCVSTIVSVSVRIYVYLALSVYKDVCQQRSKCPLGYVSTSVYMSTKICLPRSMCPLESV